MKALAFAILFIALAADAQYRLGSRRLGPQGETPSSPKEAFSGTVEELKTNKPSVIQFRVATKWYGPTSRTQIMKDGSLARIEQAAAGDWVGGIRDIKSGQMESITFTTRVPERIPTKAEVQKHKADMEAKTLKYHQQLADKGDAYGQLQMGLRYRDGRGVTNDLKQCRALLALSAGQGNSEAKSALAKLDQP